MAAKTVLPLADGPVDRPGNWVSVVNRDLAKSAIETVRLSVNRGRPFGEEKWVAKAAKRMGLGNTLRERGRPKSKPSGEK